MGDLKKVKVKKWKETAKDRRTWRDLAEKAKTHKRVIVPNDDDDDNIVPLISRLLADNLRTLLVDKTRPTISKQMTEGVKIRYT